MAVFSFDVIDKTTGEKTDEKRYCVRWNYLFKDGRLATYTYSFYMNEDEFLNIFGDMIKVDEYDFWLRGKLLQVKNVPNPVACVSELPKQDEAKKEDH